MATRKQEAADKRNGRKAAKSRTRHVTRKRTSHKRRSYR